MKRKTVLLIHGFSGGPYEVEPLANALEEAGYHCRVPLLPGHNEKENFLQDIVWEDWLECVEKEAEACTQQGESIKVIGFSMGGLLAAAVANRFPVEQLVLLNAAYIYVSPVRFIRNLRQKLRTKDYRHFQRIRQVPMSATVEFMKTVHALKSEYANVTVPTLIIQGLEDEIIHPYSAVLIKKQLKGEALLASFPHAHHLICYEQDQDQVFQHVLEFFEDYNLVSK